MCTLNEVKEKDLYEKGKLLLEIYRDVCWSAISGASEVKESLLNYGEIDTPHADMESEILTELGMERSTFYRRKREAIVVFGFSIWGAPFEEFRQFMVENTDPESLQLSMFYNVK